MSATSAGETWAVTVTPNDGLHDGPAGAASVTVANTPPVLVDVVLAPDPVRAGQTLQCTPGLTTDADGTTAFTYAYAWSVDGAPIAATTPSLTDAWWRRGQVVACCLSE